MMKFGVRFCFCPSNFTPIAQFDMNSLSDVKPIYLQAKSGITAENPVNDAE